MGSNRGRRREAARARAQRRKLLMGALAAVVVVGAGALIASAARDDSTEDDGPSDRPKPSEERDGSTVLERTGELAIEPVDGYRVVYRVDDFAGGTRVTTTEDLRVGRPFDSRMEKRAGAPPGADVTSVQITRFGRLAVPGGEQGSLTLDVQPELAGNDWRLDTSLAAIVRADIAAVREWREVLDRPCRVHRFGQPLATATPVAYAAGGDEYADVCIDESGLVLEELWVTEDRVLRRRIAVELAKDPALTEADLADPSTELPPDQGGGSLQALDPASTPAQPTWGLSNVPSGFTRTGRYAVLPPRQGADPTGGAGATAILVDVWTSGIDVLLVEQGAVEGPTESPDPVASNVDIPGVGAGQARLGLRMNEVRATGEPGPVRLRGTLSIDALVDVASTLHVVPPGTGLVPVTP